MRQSTASAFARPYAASESERRGGCSRRVGGREKLSAARRGEADMASAAQKIKLSPSRDIPFNMLVLSQSNVRRVKAGVAPSGAGCQLSPDAAFVTQIDGKTILDLAEGLQ